jgi:hypothetical protein
VRCIPQSAISAFCITRALSSPAHDAIENLVPDQSIKPPLIQKQAGRLKTNRIRKGAWQHKQTHCGNCLDWGHNRRCCTGQPEEDRVEEGENETILEEEDGQEDKRTRSNSELSQRASSQFDTIEVDQVEEEEIIMSYTHSGRIRR